MRSSQPKYVRKECKAVIRRRSSPAGTTRECPFHCCGHVRPRQRRFSHTSQLPSVFTAASFGKCTARVVRSPVRQVPGRMRNIPTLKGGAALPARTYRARLPPSRVSVLTERQPTWGRVDGRQSGSRALWWRRQPDSSTNLVHADDRTASQSTRRTRFFFRTHLRSRSPPVL